MIIDGFCVENWTCIKSVSVSDLPNTGVVVLHAPNESGKSSIVAALRACLMDIQSNSKKLEKCYPRATKEKPRVSVSFRANGEKWKISKRYGSKDGILEQQTSPGNWRIVESEAKAAHAKTLELVGGSDSNNGLQQLLWLTQAEFHLPDAKKFDPDMQAQLRGVLGVLQTPLDDFFISKIANRWSLWYDQRQKGKKDKKLKTSCGLAKRLDDYESKKEDLKKIENEFSEIEHNMKQVESLEIELRALNVQLDAKTIDRDSLEREYRQSIVRLDAYKLAQYQVTAAKNELDKANQLKNTQREAMERHRIAQEAIEPHRRNLDRKSQILNKTKENANQIRNRLSHLRNIQREKQERRDGAQSKKQVLDIESKINGLQEAIGNAKVFEDQIASIRKTLNDNPAPDEDSMQSLQDKRERARQLRADLNAAALRLTLTPDAGAAPPQVAIDGQKSESCTPLVSGGPIQRTVKRRAEIIIQDWGRITLDRGEDVRDINEIEDELTVIEREFGETVAFYGLSASDPLIIDKLMERIASNKRNQMELKSLENELRSIAKNGLESLESELRTAQSKRAQIKAELTQEATAELPEDMESLDALDKRLKDEITPIGKEITDLDKELERSESAVGTARAEENEARMHLAGAKSEANTRQEELDRLPSSEEIERQFTEAESQLDTAKDNLAKSELTEDERTVKQRFETAKDAVSALQNQIHEKNKSLYIIKGALIQSEGLHQERSAAASRVETLHQIIDKETLERDAVDHLYVLFDECREKQLGAVMGPIENRVVGWMRLLGMGNYQTMNFGDAFLPEKMTSGDGATDFALSEVSTGAQEQIGMMVRLALGSTLSTTDEPVVAVLDDPLTHSDTFRLDRMRAVLRSAAAGDSDMTPPAGPLQILIFTCHPEWFDMEGATVIDLGKLLERSASGVA